MGFKKPAEPTVKTIRFFIKSGPQTISTSYRVKAIAYSRCCGAYLKRIYNSVLTRNHGTVPCLRGFCVKAFKRKTTRYLEFIDHGS